MEYIILDDLFGAKLWGENIFRRVYHHLSNNNYDPRRVPLLHTLTKVLTDEQVAYLQGLTVEKDKALNTTKLSLLVGGQYSPRSSIYYNDMDKEMQEKLEKIGNGLIPRLEALVGPLRLGDTNFRATLLRYEGEHAQFGFHYDTEHTDCFRVLVLYEGYGTIPPFCYRNESGYMKQLHFQVNEGIFFRGTTTHHGVEPSHDPKTKRYMVGFQYIKMDAGEEPPSLNKKLMGTSIPTILSLFLPFAAYYQMAKYLPTVIPLRMSLVGIVGCLSPINTLRSVVQFYLFCCFMTMDARLALHITAYILWTEYFRKKIK